MRPRGTGRRMRLRFDARARAILERLPSINVYSLVELVLLAALAVQLARFAWAIVTPLAPLGAWQPLAPAVPADPAALFAAYDPFVGGVAPQPTASAGVQVSVFGTRLDVAAGRGSAILAGPDGVQRSIAVGEEVVPGVMLKAVAFDHVTLDRGGVPQDLYLNPADAPASPVATTIPAPVPGAGPAVGPVSAGDLQADVSGIPRIDAGRISGVTLRGNGRGFFEAAGLRAGDVVTAIAGQPVTGPQDLARLSGATGPIPLTVERGGQPVPLTLQVTK